MNNLSFASVSYCADEASAFWNQALVNQELNQDQLELIETTLKKLKRKPAVYFENRESLRPLKVWHRHHASDRIEYFTVFDGNEPVSVSTLTNFKKIGYISNVGSMRKVRGQGFGKRN